MKFLMSWLLTRGGLKDFLILNVYNLVAKDL